MFSFGAVLYEMVTSNLPFRGGSSAEIFKSILDTTPVPAGRLNPDMPPDLQRILDKALEKDRNLRYQSAADIRTDLARLKRDFDSSRASTPSALRESGSHSGAAIPVSADPSPISRSRYVVPLIVGAVFWLRYLRAWLTSGADDQARKLSARSQSFPSSTLPTMRTTNISATG